MKVSKLFPATVVAALAALTLVPNARAVTVMFGDTYTIGLTSFDAAGGGGAFISPGPVTLTFDGLNETVAGSPVGNAGDVMSFDETVTDLGGGATLITLDVVALDAGGNLTNWVADGMVAATGNPFELMFLDLASGNGGTDTLDPTNGAETFVVQSAEWFFIDTAGGLLGPGGVPFAFNDLSTPTGLAGGAGLNIGGDVATTGFPVEEFAGFQILLTVVPEPSSTLLVGLAGGFCLLRRRRAA